ncbi:MAG TPA: bifunctional diguanylate cyclase/phosphodiesterase [Paracoccaceae bacterium]|nr:bifunctional diguanylate cyclase/phosphodiesterase [Paracoccaceae bacterium]HMO70898.1 bifunctional diguanylate cyclase/phosphodiesterase [Paracoccaceae bacterium]
MKAIGGARVVEALARAMGWFRRPELMVFLPAVTLAAFWFGGERALILVALAAPMLFAMAGAFHFRDGPAAPPSEGGRAVAQRPQVVALLDAALREGSDTGLSTGCLVVQFDDAERLLDRHGRAVQIEVLARSAERMCAALRLGDTVARLEGGGFAVALAPVRRLDLETMVQLAARLQAALAPPIVLDTARLYVTASVGFCLGARAPAPNGRALLDAAQTAADDARRNGPGAIRAWAPDMARKRADRDAIRHVLERALDEGQIRPWFQPQLCTDTGAITGFEALARWQDPERGLVPPADFLPRIEDAGLADRLGEVILYQALVALTRWEKAGHRIPRVGVNFSAAELRDPRLPDRLRWELDRFELTPDRLSVEVLETVVAEADNDVLVGNVAALARMGCGVDLDDFGTGHASITAIRRFAVRRLKIDRSFVARIDEDREQQRVVSAILAMAERLGLEALAEGVETAGEHAMLAQLGCAHVQGFGIARPMPFDDTLGWIGAHAARSPATPRLPRRA